MFAVIKTGGKQYRVEKDDIIKVERLVGEAGDTVTLDDVLMLGGDGEAQVGEPLLEGASVQAEVLEQKRGQKIIVFKKKRRKNYRRKNGHRQYETVLRVTDILAAGQKKQATRTTAAEQTDEEAAPAADLAGETAADAATATAPKAERATTKKSDAEAPAAESKPKTAAKPKSDATEKKEAKPKRAPKTAAKKPAED